IRRNASAGVPDHSLLDAPARRMEGFGVLPHTNPGPFSARATQSVVRGAGRLGRVPDWRFRRGVALFDCARPARLHGVRRGRRTIVARGRLQPSDQEFSNAKRTLMRRHLVVCLLLLATRPALAQGPAVGGLPNPLIMLL